MNKATDTTYQNDLRERVSAVRKRLGSSTKDLAEIIGCHWRSVHNFLKHGRKTSNFEAFEEWLRSVSEEEEQRLSLITTLKEAGLLVIEDEAAMARPQTKTPYEAAIEEILGKEARASLERLVSPELAVRMKITVGLEWAV